MRNQANLPSEVSSAVGPPLEGPDRRDGSQAESGEERWRARTAGAIAAMAKGPTRAASEYAAMGPKGPMRSPVNGGNLQKEGGWTAASRNKPTSALRGGGVGGIEAGGANQAGQKLTGPIG